jgi:hypothetical protein
MGIDAYFIYPNYFKEHEASVENLSSYRNAVELSSKTGVSPYTLFGGYFAILLHYFSLSGFGNGIGYGEWRDSTYHKGGLASNRIYIYKLHRYLAPEVAQGLIDKDPDYFASDTDLLSECVTQRRPLFELSQAECLDHFMECRHMELEFIKSQSLVDAIAELNTTNEHLTEIGPVERNEYGDSLARWVDALT